MNAVISLNNVTKAYRGNVALENVSLSIPQGSIVGLIGKNGSGKSTLLQLCMGLLRPTNGQISVMNRTPWKERARLCRDVAYIPDAAMIDDWWRIADLLQFMARIHPRWNREKANRLFAHSDLDVKQRVGSLSKGMREKLYLLIVLAIDARLMILDEPTLGLDIAFRRIYLEQLMNDYVEEDRTIVISTHEVELFDQVFDHLIFLDHGKVVLNESVELVKQRLCLVDLTSKQAAMFPRRYRLGGLAEERCLVERAAAAAATDALEMSEADVTSLFLGIVEGGLR